MSIDYTKLFKLLFERNITLTKLSDDLRVSTATRAKFKKGEYVSLKTIESICRYLSISVDEMLDFKSIENHSNLYSVLLDEMKHKRSGGIYHETQVLMTYNSNRIEGSKLSNEQTRYIFETNSIGIGDDNIVNVDDVVETQNHFRCIDYVIKYALEPLTEALIKDLHRILKTGTSDCSNDQIAIGDYKKFPNIVGGKDTVKPEMVPTEMIRLIGQYENNEHYEFKTIVEFHYEFESIHPFQDGNGRVGRLIAFKECLRHGFVPFTIDEDIKLFYYRGLSKWNEDHEFLIQTCFSGQDRYKELMSRLNIDYD